MTAAVSKMALAEILAAVSEMDWRTRREIRELAFGDYSPSIVYGALRILIETGEIEEMRSHEHYQRKIYRKKSVEPAVKWPPPDVKLFFDITKAERERLHKILPWNQATA